MKSNVLSYADYQKKLQHLNSPEEIAAFAQELIAPALVRLGQSSATETEEVEEEDTSVSVCKIPKLKMSRKTVMTNPWHDLVGNENDAMVIDLYAKGLTTRDIANYMRNNHGVEMSQPSVSAITDKVFPLVKEWQARPLSPCYPIIYLDGMHFKVREAGKIASKCAYIALGVTPFGQKEILGIWISETEGAKFWLSVLSDIKNRGVDDVLIVCVDGLKGFPDAIKTIYPKAEVQSCIVHQIRHTVMFIPHKDKEQFCIDLKKVYTAHNEEAGREALHEVMDRWPQYRSYLKSWEDRWADLAPFFSYPEPVRKTIYTTNTIENLNRQFRKVTKTTVVFPHDDSLLKLLWLAQTDLSNKWTMPVRNWGEAMAQLTILFPDRVQF